MSTQPLFDRARLVADAVLYEGYVLYPYRASSAKNRSRFQFGVVAPKGYVAGEPSERASLFAECVADVHAGARLDVRVRFLHMLSRTVEVPDGDGWKATPSIEVDGVLWAAFDEAVERVVDVAGLAVDDALECTVAVDLPATDETEELRSAGGTVAARVHRRSAPLRGTVTVRAAAVPGPYRLTTVRVEVANLTPWDGATAERDDMLRCAMVSTHALLALEGAAFVSSVDPPAFARAAVEACERGGLWPVLGLPQGDDRVMLCAPIILYDHAEVAAESTTEFCDATEIDEMLAMRVLTLTDDEKREARATDPRTRDIVDRWGTLPWWDPASELEVDPSRDAAVVGDAEVRQGDKVRLRPVVRSDAQDLFLAGRVATVTGVFRDVDGGTHVAVTIDDDPGADLHEWYGRFRYFRPDEVEALEP